MISDKLATFLDGTSLVAGTGTATLGSQIDLGPAAAGIGPMTGLYWIVLIDTAVDSAGGAATVNFLLVTDDDVALTSGVTIAQTGAIAEATLVAGYKVAVIPLPVTTAWLKYVGVRATIGGEAVTVGTATSFLTTTVPAWYAHPQAPAAPFDA